jgi:thioredoxin reductase (NADPH)
VGAGPTGLAAALEAKRLGLNYAVIEKGCITNSIFHFPAQMVFFTTPELLEVGNMPLVTEREKPNRNEALKYYRKVVQAGELKINQYEEVRRITPPSPDFTIETSVATYRSRNVVLATGYYDNPNLLGISGEELPHVSHYYTEAHPYFERNVVVIGGQNSAAEAALELFRAGARVTLLHRNSELGRSLKYWVGPDIKNRIERQEITAYFNTVASEILPDRLRARNGSTEIEVPADQVFVLTGYHPSTQFYDQLGVDYDPDILVPSYDPESFETNVRGVFLAGSVVAGRRHKEVFIENGRFHGKAVMRAIASRKGQGGAQELAARD